MYCTPLAPFRRTLISVEPPVQITPALLSQIGDASTKDPVLSNLIQLAIAGTATQAQLKELGFMVQRHAKSQAPVYPPTPAALSGPGYASGSSYPQPSNQQTYAPPAVVYPPRDPDVIFDFAENQFDKFILPSTGKYHEVGSDILFFASLSLGKQSKPGESTLMLGPNSTPNPPTKSQSRSAPIDTLNRIMIKFRRPSPALLNLIRTRYKETSDVEISTYNEKPVALSCQFYNAIIDSSIRECIYNIISTTVPSLPNSKRCALRIILQ